MKQLRYRLLIMLAALMLLPTGVGAAEAQKDLKIQDVFTRYGKKRNVTMVELSNEMLETYGMTRYKSITIKDDPEALRFTRQCLEADQRGARKIKEVTDDGGVVSAYYQLPGKDPNIMPNQLVWEAVGLMVLGYAIVYFLEKLSMKTSK